jgi:glycine/D-amino acid oxidase-like deaminating enzyme
LAPATAEIITSQITGTKSFMDATPFSPSRFADNRFDTSEVVS